MGKKPTTEKGSEELPNEEVTTVPEPKKSLDFSFAVNAVKLGRAQAYVRLNKPNLKGDELVEAVRERYLELGGLLKEDKPEGRGSDRGARLRAGGGEKVVDAD